MFKLFIARKDASVSKLKRKLLLLYPMHCHIRISVLFLRFTSVALFLHCKEKDIINCASYNLAFDKAIGKQSNCEASSVYSNIWHRLEWKITGSIAANGLSTDAINVVARNTLKHDRNAVELENRIASNGRTISRETRWSKIIWFVLISKEQLQLNMSRMGKKLIQLINTIHIKYIRTWSEEKERNALQGSWR